MKPWELAQLAQWAERAVARRNKSLTISLSSAYETPVDSNRLLLPCRPDCSLHRRSRQPRLSAPRGANAGSLVSHRLLGFQKRELAKWSALPCLIFWLTIMVFIWLFLLGIARIVSGTFSPIEIAMTIVIGIASLLGIVVSLRGRTSTSLSVGLGTVVLFAVLQLLVFRLSLIPYIATR